MTVSYDPSSKKWSFTNRQKVDTLPAYDGRPFFLHVVETSVPYIPDPEERRFKYDEDGEPVFTYDEEGNRVREYQLEYDTVESYYIDQTPLQPGERGGAITGPDQPDLWNRVMGDVQNLFFKGANNIPGIQEAVRNYISSTAPLAQNKQINDTVINPYNAEVDKYNAKLPIAQATINSTKGDDYVAKRDALKQLGIAGIEDNFKTFYLTEKLEPWDPKVYGEAANPQYGEFDANYYKKTNPDLEQKYKEAVANDDVDIVNRYGEEGYYRWHYATQGKPAGLRGNAKEEMDGAARYAERKLTEQEMNDLRSERLGVDTATTDARLLSIPYIQEQFKKALDGDPYWKQMAKDNFLSIDTKKPEEFAALFRLSKRPEDKQVSFNYQLNTGYGISELEDVINQVVGEKAIVDVKRFGALTQNVLKDTIQEMKKAKAKEQALQMLGGFGTLGEITNINKTLADSLMNDTGIGGVLSFMGGIQTQKEDLEKSLQGITGVRNNITYNWQQWFDNTLKEKYNKEIELGSPSGEAEANIKIQADFAKTFIEKYLQPRFDQSRSMNEFVEYLDVRQEEQNPFQTQSLVDAVTSVAKMRSTQYLDKLNALNNSKRDFNPDFYFNPTGNKSREANYLAQSQEVNSDWENAKNGDKYWADQAYRFGIDLNNKADFARMHFQVKGQGKGYDASEDILTDDKIKAEIYENILPELKQKALESGTIFGQFITPEEFADSMLEGLDPADQKGWNEILEKYGLGDFQGSLADLKEYIMESLRTGSAQQIREQIKYLNERKQRPTQEKLGVTYIERPEDYKENQTTEGTELYKVFQSAGYQGSEDEFYEKMFPDVDRTEQQLLTKIKSGKGLEFIGFDTSDPFSSLGSIEGFFEEDQQPEKTDEEKSSSFFGLDYEDEEDTKYKSATGEKILSEFTSFFKGFS